MRRSSRGSWICAHTSRCLRVPGCAHARHVGRVDGDGSQDQPRGTTRSQVATTSQRRHMRTLSTARNGGEDLRAAHEPCHGSQSESGQTTSTPHAERTVCGLQLKHADVRSSSAYGRCCRTRERSACVAMRFHSHSFSGRTAALSIEVRSTHPSGSLKHAHAYRPRISVFGVSESPLPP